MDYEDYNEFKAGHYQEPNEPIKTNWPFSNENPKQPKPIEKWFVDVGGLTVGQADNEKSARKLSRLMKGTIRLYNPTPLERDQELRDNRTVKQYQRGF